MKRIGLISVTALSMGLLVISLTGLGFSAEKMEMTHAQSIQRLLDYMEIQNVMAKHSYYYGGQQWDFDKIVKMHEIYSSTRVPNLEPQLPSPYKIWSDKVSLIK